jgi:Rad3-related DNA helicase
MLAKTIADWANKPANIITTTKLLQEQYRRDFADTPNLMGRDNYFCEERQLPCGEDLGDGVKSWCEGCAYKREVSRATTEKVAFFNYYTYFVHRAYKPVLIVDEAHNLLSTISELSSLRLWHSKHKFPKNMETLGDLAAWLELELAKYEGRDLDEVELKLYKRWQLCLYDLLRHKRDYHFHIKEDYNRGKKDVLLEVKPITVRHLPPRFWPRSKVQKIILLSATLYPEDIAELGLGNRKVKYIECESPIPPANRPFVPTQKVDMSYRNIGGPAHAAEVIKCLAQAHSTDKGFVHATYRVAKELRTILGRDKRFIFHDKYDKKEKFEQFQQREDNAIFVASGMAEGIDVGYDAARWQVITSIPYANVKDEWIKEKIKRDKNWYQRDAARIIMQQTGRICRTPTDSGITYLLDNRFWKLYYDSRDNWFRWFTNAIHRV